MLFTGPIPVDLSSSVQILLKKQDKGFRKAWKKSPPPLI